MALLDELSHWENMLRATSPLSPCSFDFLSPNKLRPAPRTCPYCHDILSKPTGLLIHTVNGLCHFIMAVGSIESR